MPTGLALRSVASLTGPQKAAVLLVQLGPERSALLMSQLDAEEVELVSAELMRLGEVDPELADEVLIAGFSELVGPAALGQGGPGFAKAMLEASLGKEAAGEMMDRLRSGDEKQPFLFLEEADTRQMVSFLQGETPQTIALVMAHLKAHQASGVMATLPAAVQADVAQRIATMERTSPDVIGIVAESIRRKAGAVLTAQVDEAVGGVQPLVEIINRADPGTAKQLLEELAKRDPVLADQVRASMFTFEDILSLEDKAMQLVLREVDAGTLAVALKGARDDLRDKILNNVSARAKENLLEEMELMGAVRLSQAEEGRSAVVAAIRQLEESGQITIQRESDDEYVA
ncbi:flagellar motor switch protein FliG [Quadrisphaera sp. KR29]|uniref:flagellar motor switch protein FliG n=1 Tax=Quadrisphaera sp. KR29 TaxID=3461391 RepID=UPI00404421C0